MNECNTQPIPVEVTKSANVTKTNTLHQFDDQSIVGIESPVGIIPIVFYLKETCNSGWRGILYLGDRDTVCWMYPEEEHAEWCKQPYDIMYDALEPWDNGVERGLHRNHGILELWVEVWNKYYNGHIMYRPEKKIQGCGGEDGGYPSTSTIETVEEKPTRRPVINEIKKTKRRSCGCGKG